MLYDDESRCAAVLDAGGVAPLVALLRDGAAEGKSNAALALANLMGDGDGAESRGKKRKD